MIVEGRDFNMFHVALQKTYGRFLLEYLALILPSIICSTATEFSVPLLTVLAFVAVSLRVVLSNQASGAAVKANRKLQVKNLDANTEMWRPQFINNFRSCIMIATYVCLYNLNTEHIS